MEKRKTDIIPTVVWTEETETEPQRLVSIHYGPRKRNFPKICDANEEMFVRMHRNPQHDQPVTARELMEFRSIMEGERAKRQLQKINEMSATKSSGSPTGPEVPKGGEIEKGELKVKGDWLIPTSKVDMANRLGNVGPKKAASMLKCYGLKQAGNRQLWTVRLDGMPANLRKRLEQVK